MNARLLVTGADGQVGREMCADRGDASDDLHHRETDHRVVGLGSKRLDITDPESIARAMDDVQPGAVINCAAFTAVDAAEDQPDAAYRVNATGAQALADCCAQRAVPLIHVSTDYVFDGRHTKPIDESAEPNPVNVYGASKLAGERAVAAAGGRYCIVRAGWIYGRLPRGFAHTMIHLAGTRDTLRVVDDQHGTPCYAGYLAMALRQLAETMLDNPATGGIFHFSSASPTTWYGFACAAIDAARAAGQLAANGPQAEPIVTAQYPTRAARPRYTVLDGNKLNQLVGAPPPWQHGLQLMLSSPLGERD